MKVSCIEHRLDTQLSNTCDFHQRVNVGVLKQKCDVQLCGFKPAHHTLHIVHQS